MTTVTVRYYAGAHDAAGVEQEELTLARPDVAGLRAEVLRRHPELSQVLPACSLLVDGRTATSDDDPLSGPSTVDVLPPFAGG